MFLIGILIGWLAAYLGYKATVHQIEKQNDKIEKEFAQELIKAAQEAVSKRIDFGKLAQEKYFAYYGRGNKEGKND